MNSKELYGIIIPMKNINLRTGAWTGDKDIELDIPEMWSVNERVGKPLSRLTEKQIKESILNQVGGESLPILAKNRKNAVIVIDDIMRPTPTAQILPIVIEILTSAGLKKEQIKIVIASGSHQKATEVDIKQKVGENILKEITVLAHDDEAENLLYLGKTKNDSPIYANKIVVESDLKIAIGGVYPHPIAGFSGGAKTFVPGICGLKTIAHIHAALSPANYEGQIKNQFRNELVTIAKEIGLEFIINAVLTPEREIGAIVAGNMVEAHNRGVKILEQHYHVDTVKDADVIISNTYPYDGSYYFFSRGFWPLATGKSSSIKIAVVNGSMTKKKYYFKSLAQSKLEYSRQVAQAIFFVLISVYNPRLFMQRLRKLLFLHKPEFILFYTGDANESELKIQFPNAKIIGDWNKVVEVVKKEKNSEELKVAVYPYASLQLPLEKQ